jgi:methylaspartate ammonia-lyase
MKIIDVVCVPGLSGYFNWDLAGLKAGAEPDGFVYSGRPVTPGFTRLVQPGNAISVLLVLEDGQVAFGDCMDVILSGAAGRDPLFAPAEHLPLLNGPIRERLVGRDCGRFRAIAEELDGLLVEGRRLHTAIRYGLTQAVLEAAAASRRKTRRRSSPRNTAACRRRATSPSSRCA